MIVSLPNNNKPREEISSIITNQLRSIGIQGFELAKRLVINNVIIESVEFELPELLVGTLDSLMVICFYEYSLL